MKKTIMIAMLAAGVTLAQANNEITMKGLFNRGNKAVDPADLKASDKCNLKVTLTPNGTETYKVVWVADWKGKPTTFTGEIKGDIKNGAFTGTATDRNGKRTWKVEGKSVNDVLTFDHFETTSGRNGKTGTGAMQ